jgi:hypothetical protein
VKQTSVSYADPDHPAPSETRFSEWETIGGVQFPRRITNFHNGKRLAEVRVERTTLNGGIRRGDLSIKPADLKPVMGDEAGPS